MAVGKFVVFFAVLTFLRTLNKADTRRLWPCSDLVLTYILSDRITSGQLGSSWDHRRIDSSWTSDETDTGACQHGNGLCARLDPVDAVDCVFMESCILPCSFRRGDEVVIHWIKLKSVDEPAHSYYHNQDQLSRQDENFKGRTALFKDQISKGNASLRLTRVGVQDQGRYKCYTSTITGNYESFINLNVDAPVREVDIQQVENRMTCSSEGIYPEPELTWSTNPPSTVTPQNKTTVQQNEQQLYNISSSLIVSASDLDYSCTVSTRSNKKRTTLFKPASINVSQTETTIPCTSLNTKLTSLIWRFNHSHIILKQTRADIPYTVSEEWTQQVKSVSESGSLTLQDLTSNQEGIYSCELSDAEETYITNTTLRIEKHQGSSNAASTAGIIIGVVSILIVVGVAILAVLNAKYKTLICKKSKQEGTRDESNVL